MQKPSKPITCDEPSGLSLGERSQAKPPQGQQTSTNAHDQPMAIDTHTKTYRSVLISDPPSFSIPDKRLVIDDAFYQPRSSVFKRLGPSTANNQVQSGNSRKRSNIEPIKPAKRLSVDTSDGISIDSKIRSQSKIKTIHTPLINNAPNKAKNVLINPSSLLEVTNKPAPPLKQPPLCNNSKVTSENARQRAANTVQGRQCNTGMQTTDIPPDPVSSINRSQPFKLIPVVPPAKNKVVKVKESGPCTKSSLAAKATTQSLPQNQVTSVSINIQSSDTATILEDEAILSILTAPPLTNRIERTNSGIKGPLNDLSLTGNKLETSTPSTRDNHQIVTKGKDMRTDRSPKQSVLLSDNDPVSIVTEIRVTPTEINAVFNTKDDTIRDPIKSIRVEQLSTSDPSESLVINYDVRKSNEKNQSSHNRSTSCVEPGQSNQQPTAPSTQDHLVDDCGVEAPKSYTKNHDISWKLMIKQSSPSLPLL